MHWIFALLDLQFTTYLDRFDFICQSIRARIFNGTTTESYFSLYVLTIFNISNLPIVQNSIHYKRFSIILNYILNYTVYRVESNPNCNKRTRQATTVYFYDIFQIELDEWSGEYEQIPIFPMDRKKQFARRDYSRRLFSLDELRGCFPTAGATGEGALQRVLKGLAEVAVEIRVDKRVQGAVKVTYPE